MYTGILGNLPVQISDYKDIRLHNGQLPTRSTTTTQMKADSALLLGCIPNSRSLLSHADPSDADRQSDSVARRATQAAGCYVVKPLILLPKIWHLGLQLPQGHFPELVLETYRDSMLISRCCTDQPYASIKGHFQPWTSQERSTLSLPTPRTTMST